MDENIENLNDKEEKNIYEKAKIFIMKLISPLSRFEHQDSALIDSIKNGKWVVLDGIEHSPPLISEKLSSFCGDEPTLNVYESGFDELNFDISNINKNCKLFFIYDSSSQNSKKIDPSLFHKCIKFTLSSIDEKPNDAATLLFNGFSKKDEIDDIGLKYELSSRITSYHIEQIKISKKNSDMLAGNVPFTSRNLTFISNDYIRTFNKKEISLESWLYSIFDNYYWRSFIDYSSDNIKKYKNEALQIIKKDAHNRYKIHEFIKIEEEFKDIVDDLVGIQNNIIKDIPYNEFNFKIFVEKCYNTVPLNKEKLKWLLINIEDTLNLLENSNRIDIELKQKFYQIIIIKNIFEKIISNFKNIHGFVNDIKLSNEQLLNLHEIKPILLKFKLLNQLLNQKNSIYAENINYLLFNSLCNDLCKKLNELNDKESFEDLVIFLFQNDECFNFLDLLYPFYIEEKENYKELKNSSYIIYLWINFYKSKINFSVKIREKEYHIKFKENQLKKIYTYFILNEKKSVILSIGSYIAMSYRVKNKRKKKKKHKNSLEIQKENIKEVSFEETKTIFNIIKKNYDFINKEKPLLFYDNNFIKFKKLEASNFYPNKYHSLISRI